NNIATTQVNAAPGALQIKPKVDIVLVEDDTGRIQDNYNQISSNVQSFMNNLGSQGWNYHYATLRLTTPEGVSQAASSTEDPNWANAAGGSQWTPAYPGAPSGSTNEDMLN